MRSPAATASRRSPPRPCSGAGARRGAGSRRRPRAPRCRRPARG
uniref:Uncharacterized protein n=1 Tax=Arundo donax TaxID=35708 RepID=A0A0A9F919_ARUDO